MKTKKNIIILLSSLMVLFAFFSWLKNTNTEQMIQGDVIEVEVEDAYVEDTIHNEREAVQEQWPLNQDESEAEEIFVSVRDLENSSEQGFKKTYKLLAEVSLSDETQDFKIILDEPLDEVYSIVLVGGEGDGESEVKNLSLNEKASKSLSQALEDRYFENDWKKFDQIDNKFKTLGFSGRSLGIESSIKVYVQYQGEEE